MHGLRNLNTQVKWCSEKNLNIHSRCAFLCEFESLRILKKKIDYKQYTLFQSYVWGLNNYLKNSLKQFATMTKLQVDEVVAYAAQLTKKD